MQQNLHPVYKTTSPHPQNSQKIRPQRLTGSSGHAILYVRSLKTLLNAGVSSVKEAISVNNLKTGLHLGLKRAVPARIGARRLACFQPLQALLCVRVKTAQGSKIQQPY